MSTPPLLRHDTILVWHNQYPPGSVERAKSLGMKLWSETKGLLASLRLVRGTAGMIDREEAWLALGVASQAELVEAIVGHVAGSDDVPVADVLTAIRSRLQPATDDQIEPLAADAVEEPEAGSRPRVLNLRHHELGDAVYVGRANPRRGLAGSAFGNPYQVGRDGTREQVIEIYRQWLLDQPALLDRLYELRGRRLACWCSPAACHADVLTELVDADELLDELKAAGIRVETRGDRLRLLPASAVSEAIVARVRPRKASLLALLEARSRPARRGDRETPEEARVRVAASEPALPPAATTPAECEPLKHEPEPAGRDDRGWTRYVCRKCGRFYCYAPDAPAALQPTLEPTYPSCR